MQRVAAVRGTQTPLEAFDRFQGVMRQALVQMPLQASGGAVDAAFYDALQTALLASGATDLDLELATQAMVGHIVDATEPDSDTRQEYVELVMRHLLRVDEMRISLDAADRVVRVDVPGRPRH